LVLFLALFPKPHCGGLGKSPAIAITTAGKFTQDHAGRTLMPGFGGGEKRRQI
jgi:hypothetical protein